MNSTVDPPTRPDPRSDDAHPAAPVQPVRARQTLPRLPGTSSVVLADHAQEREGCASIAPLLRRNGCEGRHVFELWGLVRASRAAAW